MPTLCTRVAAVPRQSFGAQPALPADRAADARFRRIGLAVTRGGDGRVCVTQYFVD
jgi:hypothetical protein